MIYRIDVRSTPPARGGEAADGGAAADPVGEAVRQQIAEFGTSVGPIRASRVFLIDADAPPEQIDRAARELLADPVVESAQVISSGGRDGRNGRDGHGGRDGHSLIEIHLKPGVMDPVAASTEMALRDMGVPVREVRTGRAYEISGQVPHEELQRIASRVLANGVIESIHFEPFVPERFQTGHEYRFQLRHVVLRDLSDEQLTKLSREGHLFLSLAEMKAIQAYYREKSREPTDIELETLAQTWSEHCVHKTLKSAVDVEVRDAAGKAKGARHYDNLIKETIFASTMELMKQGSGEGSGFRIQGSGRKDSAGTGGAGSGPAGPESTAPASSPEPRTLNPEPSPEPSSPFCLSVFKDNAGVVAFDETDAVCFKVETHNHPSAIEPYGGSATGAGGVIRDILGTGLAAKPVANTDVFCVAYPDYGRGQGSGFGVQGTEREALSEPRGHLADAPGSAGASPSPASPSSSLNPEPRTLNPLPPLPKGVIHPKRILQQVVAGVRDYGNRMGIPTVNGAVYFDDDYLGNPLVFCGCVGLIPRDKIEKQPQAGDAVVVVGGRTGRDGIHGATFSSAELTDTHADEFSHAVQIGNAITEKKMADVILEARDRGLFTAVTDCGAGGLSSAVGEMAEKIGAAIELDKVPLKYAGLRYDEIWISEAQERMVLSVPKAKLGELLELATAEDVEATVIGTFGTESRELVLDYRGQEVGRLSTDFLHHGIPMPRRKAVVVEAPAAQGPPQPAAQSTPDHGPTPRGTTASAFSPDSIKEKLLRHLAHPNVASKHWVIRQYDHEVQGGSVVKPLVGPLQIGPSDAAVIRPKLSSRRGVAIGCGLAPQVKDPYQMALASIDEAVRNVVAVGADPDKVAILDNFCWPSVDDEVTMGTLVRACEACRDAALAYRIPFISGKDSLHNQFTDTETGRVLRIPNTLLISAIGVIEDVSACVTMDLKRDGDAVCLLVPGLDHDDLASRGAFHRAVARLIGGGRIASCHDVSDGGTLTALAEMCIASGLGVAANWSGPLRGSPFREMSAAYLVEIAREEVPDVEETLGDIGLLVPVGTVTQAKALRLQSDGEPPLDITLDEMTRAWRGTLDW